MKKLPLHGLCTCLKSGSTARIKAHRTLEQDLNGWNSFLAWQSTIFVILGVFALLLACIGLGGVTAYAVARRGKEIGIRMALGARGSQVQWLVRVFETGLSRPSDTSLVSNLTYWAWADKPVTIDGPGGWFDSSMELDGQSGAELEKKTGTFSKRI